MSRAILLAFAIGGTIVARQTSAASDSAQWQRECERIRKAFVKLCGEWPTERVPLAPRTLAVEELPTHTRRRVSYAVAPGERVQAYVLIPKGATGRLPGVVCFHPTCADGKDIVVGLSGKASRHYGAHLVERGFVVLAPDDDTAGSRRTKGYKAYDTAPFYQQHPKWSAVGKIVWDARYALDYFTSLRCVDPKRIGAIGHSQGSSDTIFAAAMDERIKVAVGNGGSICFESPSWCRTEWWVGVPKLRRHQKAGKLPVHFYELMALIAPRPLLNMNCERGDGHSPAQRDEAFERVRVAYRRLGAERQLGLGITPGGHNFPAAARKRAYAWLDRWLKK